jgi:O-antigen biosynthesis protein WbqV
MSLSFPLRARRAKLMCFAIDFGLLTLAMGLAIHLRYLAEPQGPPEWLLLWMPLVYAASVSAAIYFLRVYRQVWRYTVAADLVRLAQAVGLGSLAFLPLVFFGNRLLLFPRTSFVIAALLAFIALAGARLLWRALASGDLRASFRPIRADAQPTLLVGDVDTVAEVIRDRQRRSEPSMERLVGSVVLNGAEIGRRIMGVPVLSAITDLSETVDRLSASFGAPPRIALVGYQHSRSQLDQILQAASRAKADLIRLEVGKGAVTRPIDPADLLGRSPRLPDPERLAGLIANRRILVTGAGGTIGSELVRQIASFAPEALCLFDAGEFNLYSIDLELSERFGDIERRAALGDVRDKVRLSQVMADFKPHVVIHAAALKHVPLMETNPAEAILTNTMGLVHAADCAHRLATEHFIFISTDKAVDPVNMMGASKRAGELYLQHLAATSQTRFASVRFGNVLGSNGSVIPLFDRQINRGGPVTITHPNMTRFFMTAEEAACLVLQAATLARPKQASLFVLDMDEPVRILDLAQKMIRLKGFEPDVQIAISFTGPRPGEKIHEVLTHANTPMEPTLADGVMRVMLSDDAGLEDLPNRLSGLFEAATRRDRAAVIAALRAIVPEFSQDPDPTDGKAQQPPIPTREQGPQSGLG